MLVKRSEDRLRLCVEGLSQHVHVGACDWLQTELVMAKALVEFVGTFFLVFTIGMCVIDPGSAGVLTPVAIGAVLMTMIYAGGHVSGAHYNPAVSLSLALRGVLRAKELMIYFVAQLGAAASAAFVVMYLKTGAKTEPMAIQIVPAMLAEFVFTFALVYVILHVASAKALRGNQFFGVAIGFVVLAGILAVGPISGALFNPAVALAAGMLRLIAWSDLWVHLIGQVGGSVAAVAVFHTIIKLADRKTDVASA